MEQNVFRLKPKHPFGDYGIFEDSLVTLMTQPRAFVGKLENIENGLMHLRPFVTYKLNGEATIVDKKAILVKESHVEAVLPLPYSSLEEYVREYNTELAKSKSEKKQPKGEENIPVGDIK